jgi:hypothetical protein
MTHLQTQSEEEHNFLISVCHGAHPGESLDKLASYDYNGMPVVH